MSSQVKEVLFFSALYCASMVRIAAVSFSQNNGRSAGDGCSARTACRLAPSDRSTSSLLHGHPTPMLHHLPMLGAQRPSDACDACTAALHARPPRLTLRCGYSRHTAVTRLRGVRCGAAQVRWHHIRTKPRLVVVAPAPGAVGGKGSATAASPEQTRLVEGMP